MKKEDRKKAVAKQKEAIKQEIIRLQEKIDNLDLSQKYTIKSLKIDCSQGHRDVCLYFKEKFYVYDKTWVGPGFEDYVIKKHTLNYWAMADVCFHAGGSTIGGILASSPIGLGGCRWNGVDKNGEYGHDIDYPDMRAIATMLAQEYWIWIKCIDKQYSSWEEFDRIQSKGDFLMPQVVYDREMDKCWHAMKQTYPNMTLKTMREYVNQFNEQVKSGLIFDSPMTELPYTETGVKEFAIEELNKRWIS